MEEDRPLKSGVKASTEVFGLSSLMALTVCA